jgi:hypothetical protein
MKSMPLIVLMALVAAGNVAADDWPQWRVQKRG